MISIISGTDRKDSNSLIIAKEIETIYKNLNVKTEIIDLCQFRPLLAQLPPYGDDSVENHYPGFKQILNSQGIVIVCPEYNGSMPGILKLFIDYMKYPESFEFRPVAFVGHGGRFAGLRPVEHLQQVFGYRNSYIYPVRVFIPNVWNVIQDHKIYDLKIKELLIKQSQGFHQFIKALKP